MCDSGVILQGEIRCQSLLRIKGLIASFSALEQWLIFPERGQMFFMHFQDLWITPQDGGRLKVQFFRQEKLHSKHKFLIVLKSVAFCKIDIGYLFIPRKKGSENFSFNALIKKFNNKDWSNGPKF